MFMQETQEADEEWSALIKRLNFHLDVIRSQTANVEEDYQDDEGYLDKPENKTALAHLATYITYVSYYEFPEWQLTRVITADSRRLSNNCVRPNRSKKLDLHVHSTQNMTKG